MERWKIVGLVVVAIMGYGYWDADASSSSNGHGSDNARCVAELRSHPGFNRAQLGHATTIAEVAVSMRMRPRERAVTVALATAMQESGLKNYANRNVPASLRIRHEAVGQDHDSVGLFQQRPLPPHGNGSWGTVAELMDPPTSARKFYKALKRVDGWQHMPVTAAAQAVQRSAFPYAYAQHERKARQLAKRLLRDC